MPIIILILNRHFSVFDRTARNSTLSRYDTENLREDLDELKERIEKAIDHCDKQHQYQNTALEKSDERMRHELKGISQKIEDINLRVGINSSKVDRLERIVNHRT